MKTVRIKPKRVELMFRFFMICFLGTIATLSVRYGMLSVGVLFKCIMFSLVAALVSLVIPLKVFEIIICDDQITIPVKNGLFYKSISIPPSDILISKKWQAYIVSSPISTNGGWVVPIHSVFFSRKQRKEAIKEISLRKEVK